MKKSGQLLSREMLLSGAWGYEGPINTRTVDTHIRRLRHKLGKAGGAIESVRGFGYRLLEN
jgi:DNA-binding response OmpR family regulator